MFHDIPIHIINLTHREDRRAKLIPELKRHHITNYSFFEAIHGASLNIDEMKAKGIVDSGDIRLRRGEYGCYLSHLGIWKLILYRPEEVHLILEDDVYFARKFQDKFHQLMSKVEDVEWDMFYLGIRGHGEKRGKGTVVGDKRDGIYYPDHELWGTHAYLVKKESVRRLIDFLLPIGVPIDVFFTNFVAAKRLVLVDTIVRIYATDSDTKAIE